MRLSIILPAKNEEQNLPRIVALLRDKLPSEEIIICEGGSADETWRVALELELEHPGSIRAIQQDGKDKFNAVISGLKISSSEQIMIWDADGTVDFEDQMRLIALARKDPSALWTGDRLKGKREPGAMKPLNYLGNQAFSLLWAIIFLRKFDTLCGTKIFSRNLLESCPDQIINRDPFGDFSLIAAAFISGSSVRSIPIHYLARSYGQTNIRRWSNGLQLLFIFVRLLPYLTQRWLKKKV